MFTSWMAKYPEAASELMRILTCDIGQPNERLTGTSEAAVQQQVRFDIARQGGYAFRNNVGSTPAHCNHCGAKARPIRYGLANDSASLNKRLKSSDLILAIPRRITPDMVGTTIAQIGAFECKKVGWKFKGDEKETAQAAWLLLISSIGGFAKFTTGNADLN